MPLLNIPPGATYAITNRGARLHLNGGHVNTLPANSYGEALVRLANCLDGHEPWHEHAERAALTMAIIERPRPGPATLSPSRITLCQAIAASPDGLSGDTSLRALIEAELTNFAAKLEQLRGAFHLTMPLLKRSPITAGFNNAPAGRVFYDHMHAAVRGLMRDALQLSVIVALSAGDGQMAVSFDLPCDHADHVWVQRKADAWLSEVEAQQVFAWWCDPVHFTLPSTPNGRLNGWYLGTLLSGMPASKANPTPQKETPRAGALLREAA
jgi:hypothetical protein